MSLQELPELVTQELSGSGAPAIGLEIALSDIRNYIADVINSPHSEDNNRIDFITSVKKLHHERTTEWQKLKATMGKDEFMRLGYCNDCAVEADISIRKELKTKCLRHSQCVATTH